MPTQFSFLLYDHEIGPYLSKYRNTRTQFHGAAYRIILRLLEQIPYTKHNSAVLSAVKLGHVHSDKHPIKKWHVNFLSVLIS